MMKKTYISPQTQVKEMDAELIFCASEVGREMLDNRLEKIGKPLTTNDYPRNKDDIPHKLI